LIREELRIEDLSKRIQEQNEYVFHQAPAIYSPFKVDSNVSEVNY
jgi:hypothetical protein